MLVLTYLCEVFFMLWFRYWFILIFETSYEYYVIHYVRTNFKNSSQLIPSKVIKDDALLKITKPQPYIVRNKLQLIKEYRKNTKGKRRKFKRERQRYSNTEFIACHVWKNMQVENIPLVILEWEKKIIKESFNVLKYS